jgi:hypothetical protein
LRFWVDCGKIFGLENLNVLQSCEKVWGNLNVLQELWICFRTLIFGVWRDFWACVIFSFDFLWLREKFFFGLWKGFWACGIVLLLKFWDYRNFLGW